MLAAARGPIADRIGNAAALGESASERLGRRLSCFRGDREQQRDNARRTNNANDHHQRHGNDETPGTDPSRLPEDHRRDRRAARCRADQISRRRPHRASRRPGSHQGQSRLHRAHRRGAAVRRQGERLLRQARHAGRRGAEAGLLGRDARQSGARLGGQRHRRRPYPHADALPDQRRQGDAEQRADADVHPGAAQSRQPMHLGRQGIRRPAGRARHQAVQGSAGQEEGLRQVREGGE